MRPLITNILKKYLSIIALIIFIFFNSTSFAAVKQYVDNLLIANGNQKELQGLNIDVTSNFDFFKDETECGLYLKAYNHY